MCCRLFERRSHPPLHLKRMTMSQVEDFRQHGYVVIDGLITREAAGRIKAEAARLVHKGVWTWIAVDGVACVCVDLHLLLLALSSSKCQLVCVLIKWQQCSRHVRAALTLLTASNRTSECFLAAASLS